MVIGIAGCGVTGNSLAEYLRVKTRHKLVLNDPPKGLNGDLKTCDIVFVCVPVPTDADKGQDLQLIYDVLSKCSSETIIAIRSTILPGSTIEISKLSGFKKIVHVPEFLTARRAVQDQFDNQRVVVGAAKIFTNMVSIFQEIFPDKYVSWVFSTEAEMIKYSHNCFGAVKVTYWNAVAEACEKLGCDYETVRRGCLDVTPFINAEHTKVPGPDGMRGFGGTCFPVNIEGIASMKELFGLRMFAKFTKDLNRIYRKEEVHDHSAQV